MRSGTENALCRGFRRSYAIWAVHLQRRRPAGKKMQKMQYPPAEGVGLRVQLNKRKRNKGTGREYQIAIVALARRVPGVRWNDARRLL
jgi:hypothetical protein